MNKIYIFLCPNHTKLVYDPLELEFLNLELINLFMELIPWLATR